MSADELSRLHLLQTAELDIEGRMPWSSNATFLATLTVDGEARGQAVYKPLRGERPLWDFEPGLHRREVAAYRLSAAMGLDVVPPTVLRDGPFGEGSLQWFVDVDHSQHYFTIYETREDVHDQMRSIAVFDVLANNTDRKSGHVLIDGDGHLWGIDNGLCFAAEFKLRTVVWEFGGEAIAPALLEAVARVAAEVPVEVAELLADDEVSAIAERAADLLLDGTFPVDHTGRRYPWPLV
ncbi:MAG: SCO1664 family protein [Ilumatobacteraceae bacterium]